MLLIFQSGKDFQRSEKKAYEYFIRLLVCWLSDAKGSALILMNAMAEVDDFNLNSFIQHLKLKEKIL